jgi:SSS family solute:Na+ symporter
LQFKFIASPINAGALAMIAGLIVVPVVSLLTPKLSKDEVNAIFSCYDETVVVHKKKSLQE